MRKDDEKWRGVSGGRTSKVGTGGEEYLEVCRVRVCLRGKGRGCVSFPCVPVVIGVAGWLWSG